MRMQMRMRWPCLSALINKPKRRHLGEATRTRGGAVPARGLLSADPARLRPCPWHPWHHEPRNRIHSIYIVVPAQGIELYTTPTAN